MPVKNTVTFGYEGTLPFCGLAYLVSYGIMGETDLKREKV